MPIPNADSLISAYPHGEAGEVKQQIGGGVNAAWITNTCTIRLSRSFNYAGAPIPKGPKNDVEGMHTVRGTDKKNYAYRVREFDKWMRQQYGQPTLSFPSGPYGTPPAALSGKKGIICFVDCGWNDATGHFDLWDGEKCVHHAYFDLAKKVHLWESRPQATQPTGTVTANVLNVRDKPSTEGVVMYKLNKGDIVTILGDAPNGFYRIGPGQYASATHIRRNVGS